MPSLDGKKYFPAFSYPLCPVWLMRKRGKLKYLNYWVFYMVCFATRKVEMGLYLCFCLQLFSQTSLATNRRVLCTKYYTFLKMVSFYNFSLVQLQLAVWDLVFFIFLFLSLFFTLNTQSLKRFKYQCHP